MISKSNVKCTDSNVKFTDSKVRMASRFASSTQQEIEKLLEDKVSVISLSLRLRLIKLLPRPWLFRKPHPIIVYSLFHLTSTINYLRPIIWALTMAHLWLAIVFAHTDLPLIFCLVFKRLRYLVVGIEFKSFLVGLQSISKSLQTIKNTAFSCIAFDCKITNHATISFGKMRKKRPLFKLGLILPFACNEAVYFNGFYY